jgi:hypothetical protein
MHMALSQLAPFLRQEHIAIIDITEDDLDTSHLSAHIVSEPAKHHLLTSWRPSSNAEHRPRLDAEALIQDLSRLAPSVAKTVRPKQHTHTDLAFRLINDVDYFGEEESYIALSYAWSEDSRDTLRKEESSIGELPFGWVRTVEEFHLPVSEGMWAAVVREMNDCEGLWFDQVWDAVCIDAYI